ncbi:MAG: tripartite tricarboxylate transporter substrate-binding protein [Rickettsiales bacterium]
MKKSMTYTMSTVSVVDALAMAAPAAADGHGKAAEFYKGKTVTVMIPSSLGGTLGLYGRLVVENLGKHIPGNPTVIIQSRPGGGGTKGAAYAYNAAPKDGTFIAEVLAPSVLAPLVRKVKFDASKFQWIGSVVPRPAVISVWREGATVSSVDDAKKNEAILGSTGLGSETYLAPTLLNHIAGTKFKIVKGYKGGAEVNKAMEAGEVNGRMNYWSGWTAGKPKWIADNKLIHLVSYGNKIPELPNVPGLMSYAKTDEERKMVAFLEVCAKVGMGFWVPEGVPAGRVKALQVAFKAMMDDPEFAAAAKKRKAPIEYVSPADLTKYVNDVYKTSPATIAKLKQVFGFK